jgi:hypothetical protein
MQAILKTTKLKSSESKLFDKKEKEETKSDRQKGRE